MEIKAVLFAYEGRYFCACRSICLISESGEGFEDALEQIKEMLGIYLSEKNRTRLKKMGWKVNGYSVIPIKFATEELVNYASDFLKCEITNYKIVIIDAKTDPGA